MRFSIVTPIYISEQEKERRIPLFEKCIESIKNQTYDHTNFEHVIVNDGSSYSFEVPNYPWIKVINQPNLQRLAAYNNGFKNATGEIICMLDSDDMLVPEALEKIDSYFKKFSKFKLFNFGCRFIHTDGAESSRDAFRPQRKRTGHEIFGGGKIVNGTFVFHREVYEDLGAFPEGVKTIHVPWYKNSPLMWTSPYDFSAYAQEEYPEIKKFFMEKHPDHPAGLPRELGNPWGQDYYLFYKYTRRYHSKPMSDKLEVVHLK